MDKIIEILVTILFSGWVFLYLAFIIANFPLNYSVRSRKINIQVKGSIFMDDTTAEEIATQISEEIFKVDRWRSQS